jgi:hypothetical protein
MKVLKHKIIVQNTEEPDSICIEDEYYEPEDETVVDFEFLWYCNEDKLNKLIELNMMRPTQRPTPTTTKSKTTLNYKKNK